MQRSSPLKVRFYRGPAGNEPVREWLGSLTKEQRYAIGVDIWNVQSRWPVGMPLVGSFGRGLYEVRSRVSDGIARVTFIIDEDRVVLLHGFIKKTQKTPKQDMNLSDKRRRDYEQNKEE